MNDKPQETHAHGRVEEGTGPRRRQLMTSRTMTNESPNVAMKANGGTDHFQVGVQSVQLLCCNWRLRGKPANELVAFSLEFKGLMF